MSSRSRPVWSVKRVLGKPEWYTEKPCLEKSYTARLKLLRKKETEEGRQEKKTDNQDKVWIRQLCSRGRRI